MNTPNREDNNSFSFPCIHHDVKAYNVLYSGSWSPPAPCGGVYISSVIEEKLPVVIFDGTIFVKIIVLFVKKKKKQAIYCAD